MKSIYFVASSLDGFIADRDEGVGWLDQLRIDHAETGCDAFFDSVDGLLMGRKSYDFVYEYGQWPYKSKPTWVCSSGGVRPMDGCQLQAQREPQSAMKAAAAMGIQRLWVLGGGRLVGSLIQLGLLTHLSVSVMPVLLGAGTPLVDSLAEPVFLVQEESTPLPGFTQVEYRIEYGSEP